MWARTKFSLPKLVLNSIICEKNVSFSLHWVSSAVKHWCIADHSGQHFLTLCCLPSVVKQCLTLNWLSSSVKQCLILCWIPQLWNSVSPYVEFLSCETVSHLMLTSLAVKQCLTLCWLHRLWNSVSPCVDFIGCETVSHLVLASISCETVVDCCCTVDRTFSFSSSCRVARSTVLLSRTISSTFSSIRRW